MPRTDRSFAAIVIVTLALAIGVNTALFTVVRSVLLEPLPYAEPERLVRVFAAHPSTPEAPLSRAEFYDIRERSRSFEHIALSHFYEHEYAGSSGPEQLAGQAVSRAYFEMLGFRPMLGRAFTPEDEAGGNTEIVIISHGFWRTRLSGDPNVVGKTIRLSRRPFLVVGVLPARFLHPGDPLARHGESVNFWVPIVLRPGSLPRGLRDIEVIGRLRKDVTLQAAAAELATVASALEQQYPQTNKGWRLHVTPLREAIVGKAEPLLVACFGATGLVLVIACLNLACLMLARSLARSKEFAIRTALGAERGRLIREALTEAFMLSVAGALLALPVAIAGLHALLMVAPENLPRRELIAVDASALLFAAGVVPLVAILFGALPAFRSAQVDPGLILRPGERGATARSFRVYEVLVGLEIAMCLTLVSGAGLLVRTFYNLKTEPLGVEPTNVLIAGIDIPSTSYETPEQRRMFYANVLRELRSNPAIEAAGFASTRPFTQTTGFAAGPGLQGFEIPGRPRPAENPARARVSIASPGYFEAVGTRVLNGRTFEDRDLVEGMRTVIVNHALASAYFGQDDPIGRELVLGKQTAVICGVVADIKDSPASLTTSPAIFLPGLRFTPFRVTLAIRMRSDITRGGDLFRAAVGRFDAETPVFAVRPLQEVIDDAIAGQRFALFLFGLFAASALLLATIGVYGVMAFLTARRTREFGIRLALGASPANIAVMILIRAALLAGIGVGAGMLGASTLSRALASYLYGVQPDDWQTRAIAAIVLVTAFLAAALLPARKGATVAPSILLRTD